MSKRTITYVKIVLEFDENDSHNSNIDTSKILIQDTLNNSDLSVIADKIEIVNCNNEDSFNNN